MKPITFSTNKADKTLGILTCLYITSLLANVAIGFRYISIFNIDMAGGIFIFPLSFIISDIITELYDGNYAKTLIWYGVFCQIIFSLYIYLIIRMPSPNFWHGKDIFFQVFNPYLRFTIASATSIIIGSWLNIYFLSKWSILVQGKYFALRSLGASFIGELFITVSSMLIANLGNMEITQLLYMMACCFLVKTFVSLVAVWPATLFLCLMKKDNLIETKHKGSSFLKKLIYGLKDFSKPSFRIDKIDLDSKRASIYCRGARIVIEQKIS